MEQTLGTADKPHAPRGEETQPYDRSEALHALPEAQALQVLAAKSLEHIEFLDQYRLLHHLPADAARPILGEMSSDDLADLDPQGRRRCGHCQLHLCR